ncbi:MAG: methyltransferase domain-containing protein [Bacteroidales bacterium]|nr:methyltransferase domain-containing protein [Bacteroidales bacterium]
MGLPKKIGILDDLPFWSAPFGLALLETLRLSSGMKVLDIGSGSGFPMLEIADRIGLPGHVTGIDPEVEYCKLISWKISLREVSNASILNGVAEKLPFGDESFDLITSNNGLNNVQDQQAAFRECYRVAKPGAQLVATMNLPYTMIEFYEVFEQVLREKKTMREIDRLKEHISSKRKSVEFLKQLILETGFSINSINLDGFRYTFTSAEALFSHFTIKNYFLPSWKEILPGKKGAEIFSMVNDRINDRCKKNGEFTLSIPYACFDCKKPAS